MDEHGPSLVIAGQIGESTKASCVRQRQHLDLHILTYCFLCNCLPPRSLLSLSSISPKTIDEPLEPLNSAWSHPQQATARWLEEGSTACLPAGVWTVRAVQPPNRLPQTPVIDQTVLRPTDKNGDIELDNSGLPGELRGATPTSCNPVSIAVVCLSCLVQLLNGIFLKVLFSSSLIHTIQQWFVC